MTSELLEKEKAPAAAMGEDDVGQFLHEIRRFPVLSPEEELALARRCAAGEYSFRQPIFSAG